MRFSTRVFLATSAVSTAGVLVASSLVYLSAAKLYRHQYDTMYRQRLEMVARDFVNLETAYDRVALNAAKAVRESLREARGKPSRGELARLASELGVRTIAVADAKGAFVTASDGARGGNLFLFCPAYRGLVTGALDEQQTPLLPEHADPSTIAKYTMIPGHDRKSIIDVSVGFSDVSAMLQRLVDDESDIEHVVLKSPSGAVLGEVRHPHFQPAFPLSAAETEIRTKVPADEADCCECQIRGGSAQGQPYTYEFVAQVSLKSLNQSIGQLRARFAAIFALVLVLALAVSYWVSRLLAAKVQKIRRAMDEITSSRDFSRELPIETSPAKVDEIDALAGHFNRMAGEMREAQRSEARAAVAAQVAHDIRSPLTAMMLAFNQLQGVLQKSDVQAAAAEMLSALSNGISRVSGIVNRLSGRGPARDGSDTPPVEAPRLTLVDKLLSDVAQEHALKVPRSQRFAISGFQAVPSIWGVVQVTELQAALSNLLNNAFEAVGPDGRVELACTGDPRALKIAIRDNGVGIPLDNLGRVFERKFTSGKAGGSGLGLYQAKKAVEWCGGTIGIESTPGVGTTVSFTIPLEKAPSWLTDEIELATEQTLIVADDDPAVLAAWRQKAGSAGVSIREFSSIRALEEEFSRLGGGENLFFVLDQYAGDGREGLTGLQFIENRSLGGRACLSTSEFDDPAIQDRVKKLKARMIPKARLSVVRIVVTR